MKLKLYLTLAVFSLTLILAATFLFSRPTQALGPLNFGGRVANVIPCTNGFMITVAGLKPGTFMLTAATLKYAFYNYFKPGTAILGTYLPDTMPCILPPAILPTMGSMFMVGSSSL